MRPLRFDDDHPFTGRHMLILVLFFFGAIIAVNVTMVVAATGTFPGVVVRNSYVASQNYNHVLAEARAQNQAGWSMELTAPAGIIRLRLADRDGVPLRRLHVTAIAGRPSAAGEDRSIRLDEDETGYRAEAALPPGQWEVDIEAQRDGAVVYRARARLHVPPGDLD